MYEIEIHNKAFKFIKSQENSKDILSKVKLLKNFKSNKKLDLDIKRLRGAKKGIELYRLRIGSIRLIFQILEDNKIIFIKAADYRGNIYQQ